MSERIYSEKFGYWVKATVGLQITKDGLHEFVKHKIRTMIKEFPGGNSHIALFLRTIMSNEHLIYIENTSKKNCRDFKWTFKPNCGTDACEMCTTMFDKILENHARKMTRTINWKCHVGFISRSSNFWWIVAKIYMPDHNEKSTGPEDVDRLSLFSLMQNCKLFEDISGLVEDVIKVRNKLMHNASYKIDETDMKDLFCKMKDLLGEKTVIELSKEKFHELEKLEEDRIFLTKTTKEVHVIIIKALELRQTALEHDIKERKNAGLSTEDLQTLLEDTLKDKKNEEVHMENTSLKDEYDKVCQEKSRLEAELINAQREIQSLRKEKESSATPPSASESSSGVNMTATAAGALVGSVGGPLGAAIGASIGGLLSSKK